MRHIFYCDTVGPLGSVGLLALRLVMGAAFILHGWPKIQNPVAWMGPDAPVPAILQAAAALAEFGGGMALIVGLLSRLASLGIATNMIVALGMVHLPHGDPFVGKPGKTSYEPAAF
jgi:putative oxidoreductase